MLLKDVASVIRSKNAGPYLLTLDIMFPDASVYQKVKESEILVEPLFRQLYKIKPDAPCRIIWHAPALAVKCTIPRLCVSGSPNDTDVYGAQQYAPLLFVRISNI